MYCKTALWLLDIRCLNIRVAEACNRSRENREKKIFCPEIVVIVTLTDGLFQRGRQMVARRNIDSYFRFPPTTILYSNKRHSIAPLKSGVRFETDSRINFGIRKSDVNR